MQAVILSVYADDEKSKLEVSCLLSLVILVELIERSEWRRERTAGRWGGGLG